METIIKCYWCEEYFDHNHVSDIGGYTLCTACESQYNDGENISGYCGIECVMTGICDESC